MGYLLDKNSYELEELWDQYQNDPRPFTQICNEHYLTTKMVYDAFDNAGFPWKQTQHPMTCKECGKVFLQSDIRQMYCSVSCAKKYGRKAAVSYTPTLDPDRMVRKEKAKDKDIIRIAAAAREHGMSYGQYVAYLEGR